MCSSATTLVFFIFFFSFLLFSISALAPCGAEFSKLNEINKNLTICRKLRSLDAEYAWNYSTPQDGIHLDIFFGVKLDHDNSGHGWIAWGLNPGSRAQMVGTKAIIGIRQSNGSMRGDTYDITEEIKHRCRHLQPSSNIGFNVSSISTEYENTTMFFTIFASLVLNSSSYSLKSMKHVWQVGYKIDTDEGEQNPTMHDQTLQNFDSTEILDLTTGEALTWNEKNLRHIRMVHGIMNIIGWGILLPMGAIIARYTRVNPFKWEKWWYRLHVAFQIFGYLVGAAGWIVGLWMGHASGYYTFYTHRLFAIFIFTFATVQVLALRLRPRKIEIMYRKYWNIYHHLLGYALLVVICINIFKGISIYAGSPVWKWAYIGILVTFSALVLFFEIFVWYEFLRGDSDQRHSNLAQNRNTISGGEPACSPEKLHTGAQISTT